MKRVWSRGLTAVKSGRRGMAILLHLSRNSTFLRWLLQNITIASVVWVQVVATATQTDLYQFQTTSCWDTLTNFLGESHKLTTEWTYSSQRRLGRSENGPFEPVSVWPIQLNVRKFHAGNWKEDFDLGLRLLLKVWWTVVFFWKLVKRWLCHELWVVHSALLEIFRPFGH
jgi:hypothetical protein